MNEKSTLQPYEDLPDRGTALRRRTWVQWRQAPALRRPVRLQSRDMPLVAASTVGEVFAVADGVGSAPLGMSR